MTTCAFCTGSYTKFMHYWQVPHSTEISIPQVLTNILYNTFKVMPDELKHHM